MEERRSGEGRSGEGRSGGRRRRSGEVRRKENMGVRAVEGARVGPRAYGNARGAQKKGVEEGPEREVK